MSATCAALARTKAESWPECPSAASTCCNSAVRSPGDGHEASTVSTAAVRPSFAQSSVRLVAHDTTSRRGGDEVSSPVVSRYETNAADPLARDQNQRLAATDSGRQVAERDKPSLNAGRINSSRKALNLR